MTLPPPKVCNRIRKLHAQIGSSGKDADVAKEKLSQLLSEHGLTWNDLPKFFAAIEPGGAADSSNDAATGGTVPAAARAAATTQVQSPLAAPSAEAVIDRLSTMRSLNS
jgi:hypothetical protein